MTTDTVQIHGDTFKLLLSENEVLMYVNTAQKQILDYFSNNLSSVEFIVLMNGGNWFAEHLFANIGQPIHVQRISVQSYNGETRGKLSLNTLPTNVAGKEVVVIDDIIDSGTTMKKVLAYLTEQGKASQAQACVLLKRVTNQDFKSINMPYIVQKGLWLAGCGMDNYNDGRELPAVYYKCD